MDRKLIDAHLGQKVRETRTLRGISQQKFGEQLGLSWQQIQKYEKGKDRIAASTLYHMAHLLHVDIPEFYKGLGKPEQTPLIPPEVLGVLWKLHGIRNPKVRAGVSRLITILHKEWPN